MTEQRDAKELATTAAAWWAQRFAAQAAQPRLGIPAVDAASMLLSTLAPPTDEQVAAFREHLEHRLLADLTSDPSGWHRIRMDYQPDEALAGALQAAGKSADDAIIGIPWKTTMYIRDGVINIEQFGQTTEQL